MRPFPLKELAVTHFTHGFTWFETALGIVHGDKYMVLMLALGVRADSGNPQSKLDVVG